MLSTRRYIDADYSILVNWWSKQKFPTVHRAMLPEIGFIAVDENDVLIAAAFLIKTDMSIALIEWIVANPIIRDEEIREEAIAKVIKECEDYAKIHGYVAVYSTMFNRALGNRFAKLGYTSDVGVNNYWKVLRG
jgi:pseudouridine-5'-phosphate glycosidase